MASYIKQGLRLKAKNKKAKYKLKYTIAQEVKTTGKKTKYSYISKKKIYGKKRKYSYKYS